MPGLCKIPRYSSPRLIDILALRGAENPQSAEEAHMRIGSTFLAVFAGIGIGSLAMQFLNVQPKTVMAASNDRYQDYIMCAGAVAINPRVPTDGVWMLDYRSGKLLG